MDSRARRFPVVPGLVAALLLSAAPPASAADFGDPLPALSPADLRAFFEGKAAFDEIEGIDDGLGPVFNDTSCTGCHSVPAVGGSSLRLVTRFGRNDRGRFDPLANLGGSLIQAQGIGRAGACNYVAEVVPPQANTVTHRRTPPLFGLGFVDAVPDATLTALAQNERARNPMTAGRVHVVSEVPSGKPRAGRFGWKSQVPTLKQFAGDAYLNEMGITTPDFPDENCPQGNCALLACNPKPGINDVDGEDSHKLASYMVRLGAPPRGPATPATPRGAMIFERSGCAECHTPTLVTGPSPIRALDRVAFHAYSDFLLHDMGSLGDGITQGDAQGRDIRTAPLWGAGRQPTLLHDGRATSFDEAILAHDGQAAPSRDRFRALPEPDRRALIDFLNSL